MKRYIRDHISYFCFDSLLDNGLVHAIYGRHGGVSLAPHSSLNLSSSRPDIPDHVRENRRRAFRLFGRSVESLVHAHLVHGAQVAVVSSANHGQVIPACDALITADPGCGLTMNYADCAPILVYDPENRAIGLGHAGWQGAMKDVPGEMVRAMQRTFGSNPAQLRAAIGPCITKEVYEVGPNVIAAAREAFGPAANDLLIPQPGRERPHFDLPGANVLNFQRAGVTHIELSEYCTGRHTHLFFSHRKEKGKTGRFGVVFMIEA